MLEGIVNQIRDEPVAQFWAIVGVAAAAAGIGYWLWSRSAKRSELRHDTSTSKCGFATEGYVELAGTQHQMPGVPISAPLSGVACTWWEFSIQQRNQRIRKDTRSAIPGDSYVDTDWVTIREGVSKSLFVIRDETGEVVVDPNDAEVTPSVVETWYGDSSQPTPPPASGISEGPYRFTEKLMSDGTPIFAAGFFKTLTSKFPTRINGVGLASNTRLLSRPSDERPFLLSATPETEIAARLRLPLVGGLMLFYGGSVVAFLLILIRLLA